jgi:hypothetical protein
MLFFILNCRKNFADFRKEKINMRDFVIEHSISKSKISFHIKNPNLGFTSHSDLKAFIQEFKTYIE